MSFITEYVRGIAVFMLVNTFVSVFLPDSSFKNYVSIIMGMILVLLILSPISEFWDLYS